METFHRLGFLKIAVGRAVGIRALTKGRFPCQNTGLVGPGQGVGVGRQGGFPSCCLRATFRWKLLVASGKFSELGALT